MFQPVILSPSTSIGAICLIFIANALCGTLRVSVRSLKYALQPVLSVSGIKALSAMFRRALTARRGILSAKCGLACQVSWINHKPFGLSWGGGLFDMVDMQQVLCP